MADMWPIKLETRRYGRYICRYMADKLTVLSFLRTQPELWLSLREIKGGAEGVPDRTLRNWLSELVEQGAIQSRGQQKGRRYRLQPASVSGTRAPSTAVSAQLAGTHEIFSAESLALIRRIEAPIYTRAPATYREDWLQSYVPNQSAYLTPKQREQLAARGKRDPIHGRARTYIKTIHNRLLADFSFNSARLEGNTHTLADTERLLLQGAAAPGKLDAERIMILNHKEAIAYLVQHVATLQADDTTIRTLHYLLADSLVAAGDAGQIRNESVRVSGTTYAPLQGRERLTRLLRGLLEKARAIADPFEQSLFLLVHISYLQAFVALNERTARLASIIPLITGDFVPQSFVEVDQDWYLKATLVVHELNEVGPLADVYTWSYRRSCELYDTTAQAIGFDEIAAIYRTQRRALVTSLVRAKVPPAKVPEWIADNVPVAVVEAQHREKFISDVLTELKHLDSSRIGGLGITRHELEDWQRSRSAR